MTPNDRAPVHRRDGFKLSPPIVEEKTPTTVSCFRVSPQGCSPGIATCYSPVFTDSDTELKEGSRDVDRCDGIN
jgi:hypothetical protein